MSIAPDDPRLTAFALGELEAADRPPIEALLETSPEARAFVEEVRATAALLTEHLQAELPPGLEPEHRQAIESKLGPEPEPLRLPPGRSKRRRRWAEFGIAACLLGLSASLLLPTIRSYFETRASRELTLSSPTAEVRSPAKPADPERFGLAVDSKIQQAPSPTMTGREAGLKAEKDLSMVLDAPSPSAAAPERSRSLNLASKAPAPAPSSVASAPSAPPIRLFERGGLGRADAGPATAQPLGRPAGVATTQAERLSTPGLYRKSKAPVTNRPGQPAMAPAPPPNYAFQEVARPALAEAKPLEEMLELRKQDLADKAKAEGDAFAPITDNPFLPVIANPLSTFSIDVDTASYANVRRYLNQNARPPQDAVRIEELINYFPYNDPAPKADEAFSVNCEVARCPWDADHRLVRIGLKGREISADKRPASNLVFLIDVSGSMQDIDKLPLLKAGMKLLVDQLGENDRVAIVVYASQEGLALDSTRCDRKAEILSTLEQLQAGGSTNGGKGILLAYDVAVKNFIKGGVNRVILATDGDFNVGVTDGPELDRLIEEKRKTGVFLSVLGFGQGNVKHDRLERLADQGNGQYCFIDSIKEARKVLVEQVGGTLVTIAKDVKIQVQFDPQKAASYRLIGYENRMLQTRDFEDDKKDAGEIGAGQSVTALYEVVPPGQGAPAVGQVQQSQARQQAARGNANLLEVRLRCKSPDGEVSRLFTCPASDEGRDFSAASADFRFASSVAGFGLLLRDSPYKGTLTWAGLLELASGAVGLDRGGYRAEFLELIRKAQAIPAP